MEEDALESFNCLRTKMVVESDALGVGRTEEEATKEDEREGAHLGAP